MLLLLLFWKDGSIRMKEDRSEAGEAGKWLGAQVRSLRERWSSLWTRAAEAGVETGNSGWELTLDGGAPMMGCREEGEAVFPWFWFGRMGGSGVIAAEGESRNRRALQRTDITARWRCWVGCWWSRTGSVVRAGAVACVAAHLTCRGQLSRWEKRSHCPCPRSFPWLPSLEWWDRTSVISYTVWSLCHLVHRETLWICL